uniref:Mitochondrial sodium/hydrogen exchanger 9B2 n=1 Tax=Lygus hesperus TaxID=30085 RepID=A0A146L6D7_LYGHE
MMKEGEKAPKECEVLLKGPESELGAQIVPSANGSPLIKETVEQKKCGCGGGVVKLISSQGNLSNSWFLTIGSLLVILALVWAVLYVLLLDEAAPGGDLFKLLILIVSAYFAGQLVALCKLPPLLGMLIAGIVLRTCGFYKISGVYLEIVIKLREAALTTILIKAGLGLDAPALLKLSFTVLKLAFVPCLAEAAAAAVIAHVCFDYPYFWGFMLGFMLSAVSPAVVVPTLLSLKSEGYGESKGISTLVIAASGLDDIVAISLFGVFQGMIFTPGSIASQISVGPIEMVMGLTVGILWGLFIAFIPHRDDAYVTAKRTILLGAGSLGAVLGSEKIHYGGAGPLACITSAFIASFAWKNQGWSNSYHPVADNFSTIWLFIQPVLFGLIGAEIDLLALHSETIAMGFIVVFGALIVRFAACVLCVLGTKLNWKEILFVNLAWLPKATVQAALGPEPLDKVRSSGENADPADLLRGQQLLTIAVLSILITAPIGSIGISISGPYLLSNEGWEGDKEKTKSIEGADTAMHMSEGSEDVERAKV